KIFPVRKKIINYFYNYKDIKDWSNNLEIENCGLTHMLVRREVFSKIGLFDWKIKMYFAENDFCMRIRKLGKIYYLSCGKVIHHLRGVVKKSGLKKVSKVYQQDTIKFVEKYYGSFWAVVLRYLLVVSNIMISLREGRPTRVLERFLVEPENNV
ncbi:MAG: hypothetical protein N2Z20_01300, partial [Elusimicrobiales bacterium]|nr:hypothetical protein [Elusimicrobiales bacterium]